jgi:class 3 adenylate cyclase
VNTPKILIVDDEPFNVDYLEQELEDLEYDTVSAFNGREALAQVEAEGPDVILLDIMMPEMDGFAVLERLKANGAWRNIPVIIISAMDDIDSVVRGIKLGAEEYLPKPFNEVLLKARIEASLEKKRWRDKEQAYLAQIEAEREKAERLLLNILPPSIAERLKEQPAGIVDYFVEATILFADIVGFTELSTRLTPLDLVALLNALFSAFDYLTEKYGLEKVKTIGDSYMVAGGLPQARPDHAQAVAEMALEMQAVMARFNQENAEPLDIRIGINTGPVIAGVIGSKKFIYDLWGDTVNTASRMESHGLASQIQVGPETYRQLQANYLLEERGEIEVKGKGRVKTYFLMGRKQEVGSKE